MAGKWIDKPAGSLLCMIGDRVLCLLFRTFVGHKADALAIIPAVAYPSMNRRAMTEQEREFGGVLLNTLASLSNLGLFTVDQGNS